MSLNDNDSLRLGGVCLLLLCVCIYDLAHAEDAAPKLGVLKLLVNGRSVKISPDRSTRLPASPASVTFTYGPIGPVRQGADPIRILYKLEGHDADWQERPVRARLRIGCLDDDGNEVKTFEFFADGQSAGWTGNFETSTLRHRKETVVVPEGATSFWVVITSAGGPEGVGAYVVSDLVIREFADGSEQPKELFRYASRETVSAGEPAGWMRDGRRPRMARVVKIRTKPPRRALGIIDNDPRGHAQWNTLKDAGPRVSPGDRLVLEWEEMFSLAWAPPTEAFYTDLPPGNYWFHLNQLTLLGVPTDIRYSIGITVPHPVWRTPWFWVSAVTLVTALAFAAWRYHAWQRLQTENERLARQQALERERFRIAHDIHDHLGAQVTQISLLSALSEQTADDAEASRAGFRNITKMARDLVSALYDTIWVVDPENDTLEALGHHLCQLVNKQTSHAGLRCRLDVPPLPSEISISSHQRHNMSMAVKEIVNNVIKHAGATRILMRATLTDSEFHVVIEDDGMGFDPNQVERGSGLDNLEARVRDIGGSLEINSTPGRGTEVHIHLPLDGRGEFPGNGAKARTTKTEKQPLNL